MALYDTDAMEHSDTENAESHGAFENGNTSSCSDPPGLCVICCEREKDLTENQLSSLCNECRREALKLHIPLRIKVFLMAICAVFLFSTIMFVPVLSSYRNYAEAERLMKVSEYSLAYKKYFEVLEKNNSSVSLILKTAKAAMSAQYFGELAEILDTYLVEKNLSNSEYSKAMEYSGFLGIYSDTINEVDSIFQEAYEMFSEEDDSSFANQFICSKLNELLLNENLDKAYIYFSLANISQDFLSSADYFKLSIAQDSRLTYMYAFYGNLLRRQGDFDQARQIYRTAIEQNACDALSWRGLGVIELLEGEKSHALELIKYAYGLEPNGLYVPEALIIALCENGLRDDAVAVLDKITAEGYQIENDLQEYLNGTLSLEQYYLN